MSLSINLDKDKKILRAVVEGYPDTNKTKEVLGNYTKLLNTVNPKEYSLLVDCSDMGVFKQDSTQTLAQLFKMYTQTGYKHIVFISPKAVVTDMQLKRIARSVPGFSVQYAKDENEALSICGR